MDRNPISDLEAVAAMPGLEQLAEIVAAHVRPKMGFGGNPQAMLVFLAGRWALGSANIATSALRGTCLWDVVRDSAARVGRDLGERPPTQDMLRHLRQAACDGLPDALAAALPEVFVPLAREVGLLDPAVASPWHHPAPSRTLYGDGTVVEALSDVQVDDDGVHGSRAKNNPRVAERFRGKKGGDGGTGIPITAVGVHGRQRWQRVLLSVELFRDRNEIGSSVRQFSQVARAAPGGATHVVYDTLMKGVSCRDVILDGLVPVVAMDEAAENEPHLVLPNELVRSGYRSAGAREKRKGKGARRRSADTVAPKSRLSVDYFDSISHRVGTRTCAHELWAVDGALVAIAPGDALTLDAPYVDCRTLTWEAHHDGEHAIGSYSVPCPNGALHYEIDFAGKVPGQRALVANRLRPIPEAATYFNRTGGLRQDVESAFSWMKDLLHRSRASSLDVDDFYLDMIGAVLLCNGIAWDVHAAQHTGIAQHEAALMARRQTAR